MPLVTGRGYKLVWSAASVSSRLVISDSFRDQVHEMLQKELRVSSVEISKHAPSAEAMRIFSRNIKTCAMNITQKPIKFARLTKRTKQGPHPRYVTSMCFSTPKSFAK